MTMPTPEDHEIGRRLTTLTTGMDQLERRLSRGHGVLDSEGLVPIYLGDALVSPAPFEDWDDVQHDISDLERLSAQLPDQGPETPRRAFLDDMFRSLRTAARLFDGEELSFKEKLEGLIGIPAQPIPLAQIEEMKAEVDRILTRSGYQQGGVAERVMRWESENAIASEHLEEEFTRLMADAQARTDQLIYPTGDYQMQLNTLRGVPFTARCNFNEGQMDLNVDLSFTRSALKHLVAHEVFPGHSTQLLLTRDWAEQGRSTADVLLCTTNAVTGCVQEGIGDQGVHLIDWIEDEGDTLHRALRRLRSATATSAAWYQMGENWPEARVVEYLEAHSYGQRPWIEGRVRFASYPFRGPFIGSYWFGDEAVREVRERTAPEDRRAFVDYLYGQMHSPRSLLMFDPRSAVRA